MRAKASRAVVALAAARSKAAVIESSSEDDLVAVREVVVRRALAHAGPLCDVSHGYALEAAGTEQLGGGVKKALARLGTLAGGAGGTRRNRLPKHSHGVLLTG